MPWIGLDEVIRTWVPMNTMSRSVRSAMWMRPRPLVALLALAAFTAPVAAAPNIVLLDTGATLGNVESATDRSGWKVVPMDLFTLETDPPKASSDPGYYGREYTFKGDAVIENRHLNVVFSSATGGATVFAKSEGTEVNGVAPGTVKLGRPIAELIPGGLGSAGARIQNVSVIRNAADEVVLKLDYGLGGGASAEAQFALGKSGILEIQSYRGVKSFRVRGAIEHGIVPGFVGDDLLVGGNALAGQKQVWIPVESSFVGLLRGENASFVMTFAGGTPPKVAAAVGAGPEGRPFLETIEFETAGRGFYLAPMAAQGVWHREELKPTYLEKEVTSHWARPFRAKWTTQLLESGVRTSFGFKNAKREIWRGVPGSYNYPAWFEGDVAHFYFGKKIPPKGEAVVYFLEGQDSPPDLMTPVEVIKSTLGRDASLAILDVAGRKLRTHHRRGGDGVHRACTCGCTEAIQAVFEAGQETKRKDVISGALGDMNYFVERHVERIEEYQVFAKSLLEILKKQPEGGPEAKAYVEELVATAQQIQDEYTNQKENMKSASFAAELTRKTLALTETASTNNLAAYMEFLKAWRGMGGAQDFVIAQCHTLARSLFQKAGQGALTIPGAMPIAMQVRGRCREILRSPDGYEIWPEY